MKGMHLITQTSLGEGGFSKMHARGTGGVGLEYACKAKALKGLVKIRKRNDRHVES